MINLKNTILITSHTMQIAIIDDERNARLNMQAILKQYCDDCRVIGEAGSLREGIALLSSVRPDIVLLDVEMLDGTGFDLLDAVSPYHFHVIFVTAHESFAIKAFKYNAIDYILKPIDPKEMTAALLKARQWKRREHPHSVLPDPDNVKIPAKIKLTNSDGTFFLDITKIVRLESFKNYTTFYLVDKPAIVVSKTIGFFEELLPELLFHRTHQSHIININHIYQLQKDNHGNILMDDESIVPISIRKRKEVIDKIKNARPGLK
jgi:two-component system, LytTR family, response regulator